MKNKYRFTGLLLLFLAALSYVISVTGVKTEEMKTEEKEEKLLVVTSFYPVYIAALNVADGVDGVQVECLTRTTAGCVHDVQLTTKDMRLLEDADVFIINGAGMESYLDSIRERYPDLKIVDTSEGVQLLESSGEHHHEEEEEQEHDHDHVHNSHIWMNLDNYCVQVDNIGGALRELDSTNSKIYEANAHAYAEKVAKLQEEADALQGDVPVEVISTHEAFAYFAANTGWQVEAVLDTDENASLHASELSEVIELVRSGRISYIFTEELYGTQLSNILKQETNCSVVVLDTLVTGEEDKDAYVDGMKKNLETLREVMDQ